MQRSATEHDSLLWRNGSPTILASCKRRHGSMRFYTASTTSVAVDEPDNSMISAACSLNSRKTSIVDFAQHVGSDWIMPLDNCWIAVQLGPTRMRLSYTWSGLMPVAFLFLDQLYALSTPREGNMFDLGSSSVYAAGWVDFTANLVPSGPCSS